jgi:predicted nucleic acid-binding protein
LAHARDKNHAAARSILELLTTQRWQLFATNFIVAETHALTLSRLGQEAAARILQRLRHGNINIVRVTPDHENRSEAIVTSYRDKAFSFTDGTSFAVMEERDIRYAFSFDGDFTRFGFTTLTAALLR